jgi:UDP-3-O-[3-hydroxymyristoyl] glucosamine N-acyltransferase
MSNLIYSLYKKIEKIITNDPDKENLERFKNNGGIIGSGCWLGRDIFFGSEPYLIAIDNNVRITDGVCFITHDSGLWTLQKMGLLENADYFGRINVGDNCHIGMNTTLCLMLLSEKIVLSVAVR